MERLAGSDAGFLYIETPNQTSVCVDWIELAPPAPGTPPLTLADLRRWVASRLEVLPSWTWRLQHVPFGLAHPVWVPDPDFDLDYHLREATVAPPGDGTSVDAYLTDVLPGLLDLRHPLWQIILVNGLADGRQGLCFRFHHALADGAAIVTSLGRLFGPEPGTGASQQPSLGHDAPETLAPPRPSRLLAGALRRQLRAWAGSPRLLRDTLARFKAVEERHALEGVARVPKGMQDAPPTVLNRRAPATRTFARTLMPLEDLRRVRSGIRTPEHNITLNDVILALVSGALRAYLSARNELPERPLVVNVPVGSDPSGAAERQWGNRFANLLANLATDVADPRERLETIAAGTAEAKAQLGILGFDTLPAWLDSLPPAIAKPAVRILTKRLAGDPARALSNVLVSNVRVPDAPWAIDGRRAEHFYFSGPIADNGCCNITVAGFDDHLHVSIVSAPGAVDQPDELVRHLHSALEELLSCIA